MLESKYRNIVGFFHKKMDMEGGSSVVLVHKTF